MLDCVIIGGGPAGLTAAIYLARFHLSVLVVDRGDGRARSIPRSHNHAGFPDGIAGAHLIALMTEQAIKYGAQIVHGEVARLQPSSDGNLTCDWEDKSYTARSVLLATGVVNRRPMIDDAMHDEGLQRGLIRYCPVCDGYEVTDQTVAVVGSEHHGVEEAIFLRSFTRHITLICPYGTHRLSEDLRARCDSAGIEVMDGPIDAFTLLDDKIALDLPGKRLHFDTLYPALGSDIQSELAVSLGADVSEEGQVKVDLQQRTSIRGLYAAGDVVLGLDQISHAMGEGGVAATAIRNDLAQQGFLLR